MPDEDLEPAGSAHWAEVPEARPDAAASHGMVGSVVVPAIVPVLVAGWFALSGRKRIGAVVLVAATTVILARRWIPAVERAVAWLFHWVAHLVGLVFSAVLVTVMFVAVVVPSWLIARVTRWDLLDRGPGWQARPKAWVTFPDRPFAYERVTRSRRQRLQATMAIVVPVALLVAALPLRGPITRFVKRVTTADTDGAVDLPGGGGGGPARPGDTTPGLPPLLPGAGQHPTVNNPDPLVAYEGQPWARDLFIDTYRVEFQYDPFLTVRYPDYRTPNVNVEDRVRRSYRPAGADQDDALDVWFFGSSALFGLGMRDEHTIPSEVTRFAEVQGIPLRVSNFGMISYIAWQDGMLLAQMLSERPAPDLIVTYEGYNDIGHFMEKGSPSVVSSNYADEVRSALLEKGAKVGAEDLTPRIDGQMPENGVAIFNRGIDLVRDIAAANDLPLLQFYQPSLWTRDRPEDDATLAGLGSDRDFHTSYASRWARAKALITPGIIDLSDVLDSVPGVLFYDPVHHNEVAAAVIGRELFGHLRPTLDRLRAEHAAAGGAGG